MSNRLTAIWALAFGAGLALFAHDLVRFVLGSKWEPATILLLCGVAAGAVQGVRRWRNRGSGGVLHWGALLKGCQLRRLRR